MADEKARLHLVVEGRVQGVGFRYYVLDKANSMGITGWVRNTSGRQVEVMAEGSRPQLEIFLQQIRNGPPMATVIHTKVDWLDAQEKYGRFSIVSSI
ncbi:MAG: acylphosphatase [Anaerolineaceae bacterium]|nr:acylphosphatase [Anaerolineaceae bacterium]